MFGDDRYPLTSRIVAIRPGIDTLDTYAIYGLPFVITEVSTSITLRLFVIVELFIFTIIDA